MSRTYKIRRFQNGKNSRGEAFINYSLTIPTHIAEKLPKDMQYTCEVDEDGIHFRPAASETRDVELPAWAQAAQKNGDGEKPKRRSRPGKKPEQPVEA